MDRRRDRRPRAAARHLWHIREAPVFTHLVCDGIAYDTWAREIAGGRWIGDSVFYQAPLYPDFLATIYTAVGRSLGVERIVQAVLGAAGCVLLGIAGTRLFGRTIGVVAATMLAVWPSALFADGLIQKSSLDVVFVGGLLVALTAAVRSTSAGRWVLPGMALGALALTRGTALVFVPAFFGFIAMRYRGRPRLAAAGWLCAGLALLLAPVAVRNWIVGGELHVTTSQFGTNFFIGDNERATGEYRPLRAGRSDPRFERVDATELAERAAGRRLTPGEVSRYWTARAIDFIVHDPTFALAHSNLGVVLEERGQMEEARRRFARRSRWTPARAPRARTSRRRWPTPAVRPRRHASSSRSSPASRTTRRCGLVSPDIGKPPARWRSAPIVRCPEDQLRSALRVTAPWP